MVGQAPGIGEVIAGVVVPFLNLAGGIGKMLPKTGKVLPNGPTEGSEVDYANQISAALQKELGRSHRATKTVMRWTGASERTVKNWITGERGPSGDYLVALIRNSDEVMQCILHMADRPQAVAIAKIPDIVRLMCEVLELFGKAGADDPTRPDPEYRGQQAQLEGVQAERGG
ncbi:hypothetical protein OL229_15940 [Neisseriaceae bacterium JH1-16]|nr:hypothetical protein [Neisseriaceae bacterium JH1-16]